MELIKQLFSLILAIFAYFLISSLVSGVIIKKTDDISKKQVRTQREEVPSTFVFSPGDVFFNKIEDGQDYLEYRIFIEVPVLLTKPVRGGDLPLLLTIAIANQKGETAYQTFAIPGCEFNGPWPLSFWDKQLKDKTKFDENKTYPPGSYYLSTRYEVRGKYCLEEKLQDLIGYQILIKRYLPDSGVESYPPQTISRVVKN